MKIDRLITKDYKGVVKHCNGCNYTKPIDINTYLSNKLLNTKYTLSEFRDYVYANTDILKLYDNWDRITISSRPSIRYKDDDRSKIENIYVVIPDQITEKRCTKCNYIRPISEFRKKSNRCRICKNIRSIYSHNKILSSKCTLTEFRDYIYKNTDYLELHNNWDGVTKNTKPTIMYKHHDRSKLEIYM